MVGVSTAMDGLVRLLEKSPAVKISDAAKELGVERELVESWAKMLEKAGAVEIRYSVIGGAVLRRGARFNEVSSGNITELPAHALQKKKAEKTAVGKPKISGLPAKIKGEQKEKYALIKCGMERGLGEDLRDRLAEEKKAIEQDAAKLRDDEAVVVEYLKRLVEECNKLTEHIEMLSKLAERMKTGKSKA